MNRVETIANGLGGHRSGNGWICRCPAHDDRDPSLSVSERAGKVLVRCHAGCTQEAVIAALRRLNLWPAKDETVVKAVKPMDEESDDGTVGKALNILQAAAHARRKDHVRYLEGRGIGLKPVQLMMLPAKQSNRLTGLGYPAMVAPISDGELLMGAHVTWLATDLSDKVAAKAPRKIFGHFKGGHVQLSPVIDPNAPLIVGEGIETVLSAMTLGKMHGVAALSDGGVEAFRPPPCSEVVIAADNDASGAGLRAAKTLLNRLRYEGKKARIAMPRWSGWDWNDVLRERGDNAAVDWQKALAEALEDADEEDLISAPDEGAFMELAFPKRDLLIAPWLPRPGLAMVHAPRGEGKTWFALAVAKAIAAKQDFLGWKVPGYAKVLYVDGELPGAFLQERLTRFEPSPPGQFHVLCRDMFHLRRCTMPDLIEQDGRDVIDRIVKECRPDLVILDSLSTLVRGGIENDAEKWQPMQDWLLSHRWQGRSVLMVHHAGKSGQQRGTSKREDVLDTVIGLRKRADDDDETEDSVFELTFTKTRDFHGKAAESLLARLSMKDGKMVWTHEPIRSERDRRIREMLGNGVKQSDIAKELKLTAGRIAQIVKDIKREDNIIRGPWQGKEKDDDSPPAEV